MPEAGQTSPASLPEPYSRLALPTWWACGRRRGIVRRPAALRRQAEAIRVRRGLATLSGGPVLMAGEPRPGGRDECGALIHFGSATRPPADGAGLDWSPAAQYGAELFGRPAARRRALLDEHR